MPELLLCCAIQCSHSRLFYALRCCLLLLQLCLLLNHLRSSAFSPFSTGFCHFLIFHTTLSPIFHTSLSPFFFINSCSFSHYLSFLLPEQTCGRNVVHSIASWSTVFCSLNYVKTFGLRWMLELLLFCAIQSSHSGLFCAFRWFILLLQLCLLSNHLRSSAFSPFSTGVCHFRHFHNPLSPIFHT